MMKKIFLLLVFSAAASCSGGFHPPAFVTIGAAVRLHLENNRLFSVNAGLDSFDYKLQWYPVVWARDLPLNQPTRVKLFDVNYVVAKTKQQEKQQEDYVAMLDECPHKKVALSEGRVTECGHIQCSYHGWTFDGTSGRNVEIPQTVIAASRQRSERTASKSNASSSSLPTTTSSSSAEMKRKREDGTAVAITEAQGMIWVSPFLTPLEALAATKEGRLAPPPRVPEMDMPGYKYQIAIRDFPIDWTVLMENIMDPDHGYFAHSSSGNSPTGFDWYSSDGVDNIMEVKEEGSENGWKITSSVNAVSKMGKYNREVRSTGAQTKSIGANTAKDKKSKKEMDKDDDHPPKLATTTFVPPSVIYLGRRDNITAASNFVTAFWVCPTGTGTSRFMSAAVSKAPFSIPRWIVQMQLNNFLDQDTFLLLGQHRAVLKREAECYIKNNDALDVRKSTYLYRSPSEKLPVKVGKFFDATLSHVPNRKESLIAWYNRNNNENKLFEPWPDREYVLDRYEQHTLICRESMDVVNRCEKVMKSSKILGWALILLKLVMNSSNQPSVLAMAASAGVQHGLFVTGFGSTVSSISSIIRFVAASFASGLVQTKPFISILATLFASYNIAARIKREFFFKFNDRIHHEDIKFIVKHWADLCLK